MSDAITIKRAGETLTVEPGMVALVMPVERAHAARVAMSPRLAGETESNATKSTRRAISVALARVGK
ncbi:hypothetical protein [Salipiger abyssi]|uniref:hypothetical protein n=1 Tax=Salipiger abyssi TaxID=1250539 RepID=UPI00097696AB|nr:hypothetical protein [Salipiger abyssi]